MPVLYRFRPYQGDRVNRKFAVGDVVRGGPSALPSYLRKASGTVVAEDDIPGIHGYLVLFPEWGDAPLWCEEAELLPA